MGTLDVPSLAEIAARQSGPESDPLGDSESLRRQIRRTCPTSPELEAVSRAIDERNAETRIDLGVALARMEQAKKLRAQGHRTDERTCPELAAVLESLRGATLETQMDENGVLVLESERTKKPTETK